MPPSSSASISTTVCPLLLLPRLRADLNPSDPAAAALLGLGAPAAVDAPDGLPAAAASRASESMAGSE